MASEAKHPQGLEIYWELQQGSCVPLEGAFSRAMAGQEESREGSAGWVAQRLAHIAVVVESGLAKSGMQVGELAALPAVLPEG